MSDVEKQQDIEKAQESGAQANQLDTPGVETPGAGNAESSSEHIDSGDNTVNLGYLNRWTLADLPVAPLFKHRPLLKRHWLQTYLCALLGMNLFCLFFNGHGGDLGYWQNWITQLQTQGYARFSGDYPPVFLHWLYLAGKVFSVAGVPVEANIFLKFLVQIPIIAAHSLLLLIIYQLLQEAGASKVQFHTSMVLTAFNPAILFDGPIWGQVDLLPACMALAAILLCFHPKLGYLAIPTYMLAMLTKFQMICFAPVFAVVFFTKPRTHLVGILLSTVIFVLGFLPFIITGHFTQAFQQAYINTLGQYPVSTLNAANLWILLTGNTAPDSTQLIPLSDDSSLAKLLTAKHFGMLAFAIFCLSLFVLGLRQLLLKTYAAKHLAFKAYALQTAMFCALAFFTLLPAMHERYLFPAVVAALAYTALIKHKYIYPIAISAICTLNMVIILGINGSDIWLGLSLLMMTIFTLASIEILFGSKSIDWLRQVLNRIARTPHLGLIFALIAFPLLFVYFLNHYQINRPDLNPNQRLLTRLSPIYAHQDHGSLRINRSFDGNILSIGGKRYAEGLGTHANSNIQYRLPENTESLSFKVGLDDEVGTAGVTFSVWGDSKLLWQSAPIVGLEKNPQTETVDLRGVKLLRLNVSANGSDKWDHADWINPVLTLTEPSNSH